MNAEEFYTMRACEDGHWWYLGLRDYLNRMIRKYAATDIRQILDAGCGTGRNLQLLSEHFPKASISGLDIEGLALSLSRGRNLRASLTQASVTAMPFEDNGFDLVTALDVFYHRNVDEDKALRECFRVLKTNGIMLVNLPAFECLRGSHDHAVGGLRRYTRRQIYDKIHSIGFRVLQCGYWNFALFPAAWASRKLSRLRPSEASDVRHEPGVLNALVSMYLRLENKWTVSGRAPWGTSVFCAARKD